MEERGQPSVAWSGTLGRYYVSPKFWGITWVVTYKNFGCHIFSVQAIVQKKKRYPVSVQDMLCT
eukprot:scaffold2331_cov109-Skeletonema_marinoi.AAC.4